MAGEEKSGPKAKPGWYPDDSQVDTVRYWDGESWTDQRAPASLIPATPDAERPRPRPRKALVVGGVLAALAAVAVVVVLIAGGGSNTKAYPVPSGSMEPTFKIGDTATVDLDAYKGSEPAVGDVVVLHPPEGAESASECGVLVHGMQPLESGEVCPEPTAAESGQLFLKRIVAVGGDTLSIKDGQAIVNGEPQDETDFIAPCGGGYECNLPKTITIPSGYFFTLGDNRGESDDSRYWGPVPAAWIVGRVDG
jgi:signal peptidase I